LFTQFDSLEQALKSVYPHFKWDSSRFASKQAPKGYWQDTQNVLRALAAAEQRLGITEVIPKQFD